MKPKYELYSKYWLYIYIGEEKFAVNLPSADVIWRSDLSHGYYISEIENDKALLATDEDKYIASELTNNIEKYRLALKYVNEYKEKYALLL